MLTRAQGVRVSMRKCPVELSDLFGTTKREGVEADMQILWSGGSKM